MINKKIGFIGAGNMAYSLIGGLIANGCRNDLICISDSSSERRNAVCSTFSIQQCDNNIALAEQVDIIILAVKPQVLKQVCAEIQASVQQNSPLIVSIAAGITSTSINQWLGGQQAIVRTMPNTPALVQSGATALYANSAVDDEQKTIAESAMRAVGLTLWLDNEAQMDAVTAVSGSGPAYFFLVIEAIEDSAVKLGLDKKTAHLLAVQTALGAAKMALESDDSATTLREKVTSPGGTTEKAIGILNNGDLVGLFNQALSGAKQRSIELSEILGK